MRELLTSIAVEAALAAGMYALMIYVGWWMGPAYYAAAIGGSAVLLIQMTVRAWRDVAACQHESDRRIAAPSSWRGPSGRR